MLAGSPFPQPFSNPYPAIMGAPQPLIPQIAQQQPDIQGPPEARLSRAINYYADYSGCGFWRLIWPEHLLNANQQMTVHGSTVMCFDPRWYVNTKAVRIQRQATSQQKEFFKFLKQLGAQQNFKVIYDIDDIMFYEDIPEYNKYKPAFTNPEIRANAVEMMQMADEVTVTCDFMKEYYMDKTGNKNVTVIPNYPPKWWMGNFYNEKKISRDFDNHSKKPRILYAGSGAHFDVDNRVNQRDDFGHVLEVIAKTKDKYQWVFLGGYPLSFHQLVRAGIFEYHPWETLYNYPEKIYKLNCNAMVAPLQDNIFNRAKSDLKYIEACCYGIPIVCQDMVTYSNAKFKFKTGEEMIDQVDDILDSKSKYMTISARARSYAESRFLENKDNINKYYELYNYGFGAPERVLLNKQNGLVK